MDEINALSDMILGYTPLVFMIIVVIFSIIFIKDRAFLKLISFIGLAVVVFWWNHDRP